MRSTVSSTGLLRKCTCNGTAHEQLQFDSKYPQASITVPRLRSEAHYNVLFADKNSAYVHYHGFSKHYLTFEELDRWVGLNIKKRIWVETALWVRALSSLDRY